MWWATGWCVRTHAYWHQPQLAQQITAVDCVTVLICVYFLQGNWVYFLRFVVGQMPVAQVWKPRPSDRP
jgi:hypothetical protein